MTDSLKARLRVEARGRRASLDAATRAAASLALRDHLLAALPRAAVASGDVIAGYCAIRDEIDPEPTLIALMDRGFALALPASLDKASPLVFRAWRPGEPLLPDRLGVPAPRTVAAILEPALILVPLLAFDAWGYRLGYGAGCYDRTLAAVRAARPMRALGLAFAVQEVASIPAEFHDTRLDGVVTECGARWFDFDTVGERASKT
jgi:5-formyltetrahydrofolate cyclo-ligase